MANPKETKTCAICGKNFALRDLVPGIAVRDIVTKEILEEYPEWSQEKFICRPDLNRYRSKYVHSLLESEKGELTSLEREVLTSLRDHETLSKNIATEFEGEWTLGERLADRIAAFGRSWTFLILFAAFLTLDRGQLFRLVYTAGGSISLYIVEFDSFLYSGDSGADHNDESEPTGSQRSLALRT